MSHHIQEPAIKQIRPVDVVARNTGSKLADAVATVPTDIHAEKESSIGLKTGNTVGSPDNGATSLSQRLSPSSRAFMAMLLRVRLVTGRKQKQNVFRSRYSVTVVIVL